ncbi:ABC-type transport auxiliary lipoprotein family protein [Neisseriaceae bacterium ESL0693]|nr:ABC-type transport auxiliary lipoprotein family protein [Neisseriaceae bacterium ESL0693]
MKLLPLLLISTLLMLSACASQSTTYYRLPDSDYRLPAAARQQAVQIKVVLADSINQGNLLYQESPNTLHFAQQHQWADDLSHEIASVLANHLNQTNGYYSYSLQPNPTSKTLTVHIETFQGSYDGHIHINGYSEWQGMSGQNRNFHIRIAQKGNGYNNMVNALSQGLNTLASEIQP